jgi:AraC family transcriptional regulator
VSAREIVGSTQPLAAVAADAGYPDYETFSRAFKRRFGETPSAVRARRSFPQGLMARAIPFARAADTTSVGLTRLCGDPETVSLGAFRLAGLPFYIEEGTPSFHSQWRTFMGIERRVARRTEPETFYQFSSWTEDDGFSGLSILCALETDRSAAQEPLFSVRDVPASAYLKFRHAGSMTDIHLTYEYIYREWLSSHDVRLADCWEFQRYADGGAATEIYIPIDVAPGN